MQNSTETWTPIPGFEGYYSVSTLGRVRSERRTIYRSDGTTQTFSQRLKRLAPNSGGYLLAGLARDGKAAMHHVHRLVLEAFVGPCPDGLYARHLNGDRNDNRLVNLRYGTPSENNFDTVDHGMHWQAKKTRCKYGHEYTAANTYFGRNGRECRTCRADRRHSRPHGRVQSLG